MDAAREELNRINVFPVPDGDTGTNFALTLRAAAESVRDLDGAELPVVTKTIAEACVFNARGNSGMLLSHFVVGFQETLGEQPVARTDDVARAFRGGADHVLKGLDEPVEGTILTVCRDAAEAARRAASRTRDLADFMARVLEEAQASLQRTPELLPVLREAGVVDAGAMGFVRLIEGIVRLIDGDPIGEARVAPQISMPDVAALTEVTSERDYRYCTEVLVRGDPLPATTVVRSDLRTLGGSIVVLATESLLKIHVHTDSPDRVFELAGGWGEIQSTKADDMREQRRERHQAQRSVGIVVDSTSDLPDNLVDRHAIVVVPVQVVSGNQSWLDRVEIDPAEVYERMRAGEIFTTSQPTPGALVRAFEDARAHSKEIIGMFVSGALSGTLGSAQAAAKATTLDGISIFDSRTASWGLGLLALRAAELAEQGWEAAAIIDELERIRSTAGGIFTVDTFENLLQSGRVGRGKAWLGELLDIKPILEITSDGRVAPLDRVRGRDQLIPRVLKHLDQRFTPRPARLRISVVHAAAPTVAEQLRATLVDRYSPTECHVGLITAALGVHTGPGAWGLFYQIEDPPSD